jgi:hypothetical protein
MGQSERPKISLPAKKLGQECPLYATWFQSRSGPTFSASHSEMFLLVLSYLYEPSLWPVGGSARRTFMSWLRDLRFLRIIPWLILSFAVPAFAQFEVAPDHFDSSETNKKALHQSTTKKKAATALPVTSSTASPATAVTVAPGRHKQNIRRGTSNVGQLPSRRTGGQTSSSADRSSGAHRKRSSAGSIAVGSP